ncbi:MAG: nucleotidyltransferase domain-containing protein, partial [FCB group bacterium]
MVKVPEHILEIIRKFIAEALKDNIHIERAVLFGSYAKGTNHEYSDIDLAVVSEDFEGISFYDAKKLTKAML